MSTIKRDANGNKVMRVNRGTARRIRREGQAYYTVTALTYAMDARITIQSKGDSVHDVMRRVGQCPGIIATSVAA